MPETFDDLLAGIAESGARAAGETGAAAARARGRQRAVRRRAASAALSLVLIGGAAGIAVAATAGNGRTPAPVTHTGTPAPAPSTASTASASPSASSAPSSSPSGSATESTSGDLNTIVPGAWAPLSSFPMDSILKWAAQSARPAAHTEDRQWFSSCLGGRLATTGALGYQELTAKPGESGSTDSADQVLFFYPTTTAAQSALATISAGYANCPKATAGLDDKPITDSLVQTEHIDGGYAWLHTYIDTTGLPDAPADRAAFNHEYFVQRGDAVELVWLGGVSEDLAPSGQDLGFLSAMAGSLCTYGGECEPAGEPLTTTITPSGAISLKPGGPAAEFTVTIKNNLGSTVADIAPVVSLSHCSCSTSAAAPMMPQGTLELWDSSSGTWNSVVYDREGSGMDFITITPVPAFDLAAGQAVSFKFRLALSASQLVPVQNGSGAVDVTIIHSATKLWIGDQPEAQHPVTVTVG
jgi:hypothetical protein